MILLIISLILSVLLNITLIIGAANLTQDVERYEDYFEAVHASIKTTLANMRGIDLRGAFEAEDEVGTVFKGLVGLVNSLEEFVSKE